MKPGTPDNAFQSVTVRVVQGAVSGCVWFSFRSSGLRILLRVVSRGSTHPRDTYVTALPFLSARTRGQVYNYRSFLVLITSFAVLLPWTIAATGCPEGAGSQLRNRSPHASDAQQ